MSVRERELAPAGMRRDRIAIAAGPGLAVVAVAPLLLSFPDACHRVIRSPATSTGGAQRGAGSRRWPASRSGAAQIRPTQAPHRSHVSLTSSDLPRHSLARRQGERPGLRLGTAGGPTQEGDCGDR
jgi:hypothetical protein